MHTRVSRLLAVTLVVVVALAGCVRRLDTPPPPKAYDGHYFRFPTGLQLAVYEISGAARVSVTVSYGAGGTSDPAGQEGTAHLVEHLTGHGRAQGERSIDARLFALGALDNASTSPDETQYVANVPVAALPRLLELEAERMRAPIANVTEAEFTAERGVVDTELHQRSEQEDAPHALVRLALTQLFSDHPYGRPVLGTEGSLRRIELAHLRQWARTHYTPDNAVIVVHGPVRPDQVKAMVELAFGGLALADPQHPPSPPASNTPPELPVPPVRQPPLKTVTAPVSTRELWMVWAVPGRTSGDDVRVAASLAALQLALEKGFSTDDRVEDVDVLPLMLDGMSVVAARLELSPDADALRLDADVRDSFHIPDTFYWSDQMAKPMAEMMASMSLASLEGDFGPQAASYVRAARRADFAAAMEQKILAGATPDFFADAARYFGRSTFRSLLLVPTRVGKSFRSEPPVDLTGNIHDELSARSLPGDGAAPSALIAPLPEFETETLGNQMRVVIVRRPQLPLVETRLVLRTRPFATLPSPIVPGLAVRLGGGIDWSGRKTAYDGHTVYEARSLSGDRLYLSLERVGMWARDTLVGWNSFDYVRNRLAERYERVTDLAGVRLAEFPFEHLYGQASLPMKERAERLRKLDGALVNEWLEHELRPQNATLILVGDVPSMGAVKAMVFWAFFGWDNTRTFAERVGAAKPPAPSAEVPWPSPAPAPKAPKALLHASRAALARVSVAIRAPPISVESHPGWAMLSVALEDRMRGELRERRGIAYGVSTSLLESPEGSILVIDTSVRPEHAAQVIGYFRESARAFKEQGVPAAAVERARWDLARTFDAGFSTLETIADRVQAFVRRDTTMEGWSAYRDGLLSAPPETVSAAAAQLEAGAEAITVTGNIAGVEAALKSAGVAVEVVK